jgi:hypothetical protein
VGGNQAVKCDGHAAVVVRAAIKHVSGCQICNAHEGIIGGGLNIVAIRRALGHSIEEVTGDSADECNHQPGISLAEGCFQLRCREDAPEGRARTSFPTAGGALRPQRVSAGRGIHQACRDDHERGDGETTPWLRGMFEAAWCYGWRESEIQNLRVHQFDPVARIIILAPGETKNDLPRQTPPMDETIHQLISACVAGKSFDDFIFTRDDGEPIRDFRDAWWKACVVAGRGKFVCQECRQIVMSAKCESCGGEREYEGLLFHDLRRTGIRNMIRNGIPEKVTMVISGHKARSVFDRYNITNYSDLVDAGRKIREGRDRIKEQHEELQQREGFHGKTAGVTVPDRAEDKGTKTN